MTGCSCTDLEFLNLIGSGTTSRLKQLGMEFTVWVFKHVSNLYLDFGSFFFFFSLSLSLFFFLSGRGGGGGGGCCFKNIWGMDPLKMISLKMLLSVQVPLLVLDIRYCFLWAMVELI
jgi:hypothetical protein